MVAHAPAKWHLTGTAFIACNCEYGCPCNFNAMPSHGFCEGGWTWHIDGGSVDDVALAGLNFSVFVKWPGAIHEGNGEGLILVDERATEAQRDAIAALVSGQFGARGASWPGPGRRCTVRRPFRTAYTLTAYVSLAAGDCMQLESATIKNPVTGADTHPSIVLPEGLIVKGAGLARPACSRWTRASASITAASTRPLARSIPLAIGLTYDHWTLPFINFVKCELVNVQMVNTRL